ncbi:type I-D CRISPR-associated protein Cas10d/Csc3 [Baaleninema simplex]|uniref:type I-D CRISPR-associated protein Cas10d/Csc3 n=1 Tax=Baaleninema simplex TaxID=2862350 RepID=UPI0003485800|nr:type I-D CRISPR-associated protein Cas10d/Csc3 [Baaleninema simplex]
MSTLLQELILSTLPEEVDPILQRYIEVVLPEMERKFGTISALGGSEVVLKEALQRAGDSYAVEKAKRWSSQPDQNLCVHCLNALLTVWNLSEQLSQKIQLVEKYLLCLGMTLHDYNKYCNGNGEAPPKAHEIPEILNLCRELGRDLNFSEFWSDWEDYILDICYLAQNTQLKEGINPYGATWAEFGQFNHQYIRLKNPLRYLLAFGDVAVHMNDPGDIFATTRGDRLRERLSHLKIKKKLVYHRLRDTLGLLTNAIHNATLEAVRELDWKPLLFFARGVVYLAPTDAAIPERSTVKKAVRRKVVELLGQPMQRGEIGFKRDGKGLKIAPQTTELFTAADLIGYLPGVIQAKVANKKSATLNRLKKLLDRGDLDPEEYAEIQDYTDLRADRLAEFILVVQREFFDKTPEYTGKVLELLKLDEVLTSEQIDIVLGGVNYGWYRAAAHYLKGHATYDEEQVQEFLEQLAEDLVEWSNEQNLLPEHSSETVEIFENYLDRYLDVMGWENCTMQFQDELNNYAIAKTKASKQPICSLSSGEFISEDQMDSVVLFKPQQYSNKNALGGRQIKRGISKIWALEMLLRQANWSATPGKFEDRQPVFLYMFPAYVYAPQIIAAIRRLTDEIQRINLWEIHKHWKNSGMNLAALQSLDWLDPLDKSTSKHYSKSDLPFMATIVTTTRNKTVTDAWVQPTFLALALPLLLGVRVVASSSNVPIYASDSEFLGSAQLDGAAGFWSLFYGSSTVRVQELEPVLQRLLVAYSIHLENCSNSGDARWQALNGTVREVMTDVLNIFALAQVGFRKFKREPHADDVYRYWKFAEIWSKDNVDMTEKLKFTKRLVEEYRQFYQVRLTASSHAILMPLSKALETILSAPAHLDEEELILQGAGQLKDALDRQEAYTRPILMDKSLKIEERLTRELQAIHGFMTTCVRELFQQQYKGDRALLQENRNRIKSGAEFAYRLLTLESKNTQTEGEQAE